MLKFNRRSPSLSLNRDKSRANSPHSLKDSSGPNTPQKLDFSWASLLTLCVTIFTAVMFGAGKAYREEFFESFGFTDAAIPLSFQDITYLGITKQLLILMAAPWFAMAFVFGYIVLFMVMSLIVDRLAIRQQRKFRSNKKPSGNVDYLFNLSGFLLGVFGSIAITSLLALFYIAQADKLGKKDAASARASVVPGSKVKPELSYVVIERVIGGKQVTNEGYLIGCSERVCAVYSSDKGKGGRMLVPLEGVISFSYKD